MWKSSYTCACQVVHWLEFGRLGNHTSSAMQMKILQLQTK